MKSIPRNDILTSNCRIRKGVSFSVEWQVNYYQTAVFLFIFISNGKPDQREMFRLKRIPLSKLDCALQFNDLIKLCKQVGLKQRSLELKDIFGLAMRNKISLEFRAPGYKERPFIQVNCGYSTKRFSGIWRLRPFTPKNWWKEKAEKFFVLT